MIGKTNTGGSGKVKIENSTSVSLFSKDTPIPGGVFVSLNDNIYNNMASDGRRSVEIGGTTVSSSTDDIELMTDSVYISSQNRYLYTHSIHPDETNTYTQVDTLSQLYVSDSSNYIAGKCRMTPYSAIVGSKLFSSSSTTSTVYYVTFNSDYTECTEASTLVINHKHTPTIIRLSDNKALLFTWNHNGFMNNTIYSCILSTQNNTLSSGTEVAVTTINGGGDTSVLSAQACILTSTSTSYTVLAAISSAPRWSSGNTYQTGIDIVLMTVNTSSGTITINDTYNLMVPSQSKNNGQYLRIFISKVNENTALFTYSMQGTHYVNGDSRDSGTYMTLLNCTNNSISIVNNLFVDSFTRQGASLPTLIDFNNGILGFIASKHYTGIGIVAYENACAFMYYIVATDSYIFKNSKRVLLATPGIDYSGDYSFSNGASSEDSNYCVIHCAQNYYDGTTRTYAILIDSHNKLVANGPGPIWGYLASNASPTVKGDVLISI